MAERQASAKGRRMGSSRRKQLREGSREAPVAAPGPGKELPWASEIVQRVQDFFRERDKDQAGFVTRSDMQKLQEEDFPCSTEELELVFDGLDAAGTGRLSTDEFAAGLSQFLSSQKAARDHHRRKTASRRVRLVLPSPTSEGTDSEERRQFAAFVEQLGTDDICEEQIWQLWVKLREDEPQLLGNLEGFLAKMGHRIQEAWSKKAALEVTLNKRVAEHDQEVRQLCEALEQQIQQERQRLEQESVARSRQRNVELQQALDANEREVQRLVTAQMELEARCRSLRSKQQATSTENRQLEESNRALEDQLQHLHQQLQQTHRCLQTARATVAWERTEEPGDRAVAEVPGEMPMSLQMSLETGEDCSEKRIRLGSQSTEPKAKRTHQVVWEMLPAETNLSGALPSTSPVEEDPFPEFLKEERFSDQSSLLREMNDAIAALSKQLKPQALDAPPPPADTAHHPQDDAEPQTGLEAAAAHGTTSEVLQETIPSHAGHELFEGDLKEGPAAAELRAPDVTQAGASTGAGHRRAQEPGAEQGESPEEQRSMLFLQGTGAGVKEVMLKAAEHLQGAAGESTEAGEEMLVEVEREGWMQEKIGWEKAQLPGEAEEGALSQGENLEAGLGSPEAAEAGQAAGWQLGSAAAPGEHAQPLGAWLGEEADPPSGFSEKLEIKPGERPEPEPPRWGEAQTGAAQGDGVLPEATVAPDPGTLEEEHVGEEVQLRGETLDAGVLPVQAQHGGSSGAGAQEGQVKVTQPREAEPHGESARGDATAGGSVSPGVPLPAAVPPANVQDGGPGTDVQPWEAQSSDANVRLLAEVEADLQPPSKARFTGTEQEGSVAPDVRPLVKDDKPELLALEAEDSQADTQLCGAVSSEPPQGGGGRAAVELREEAEDGGRGQVGQQLLCEPVLHPHAVTVRWGGGAAAGVQPREEAEILGVVKDQSADANVQLLAGADELKLTPGWSPEADLQLSSEAGSPGTEQGEPVAADMQALDSVDKPELVELAEAEKSQADTQLIDAAGLETCPGGEHRAATELREEAEDGGRGQGECELPHEPGLDPQGEGAAAGVQLQEEVDVLDVVKDQGADANVQLLAGVDELKLSPGRSTESDLQLSSGAGSPGTEQGEPVAPAVQPLHHDDEPELLALEVEDAQADTQLCGGLSPEAPWRGVGGAAVQPGEEVEDWGQGQGECELPHEPGLDPQGEGAAAGVQPQEEAEVLDVVKDQVADANVQLLAGADELKWTPGWSPEADLQLSSEAGSPGTEQGEPVAPDVQPLDQVDKPELVEMAEAEDSQADTQLCGAVSSEPPQGGGGRAAVELREEVEDWGQGQVGQRLLCEPVLHPHAVTVRWGGGAAAGVQPWEEAEVLDVVKDQGADANVQLLAAADELKLSPGRSTESDLQLSSGAGSPGTEQGEPVAPAVQPLHHDDEPELLALEVEDAQADMQLCGGLSPEAPWRGVGGAAVQPGEEVEDWGQGQGGQRLLCEPVLHPHAVTVRWGGGAAAGVQPREEAEILGVVKDQSADANVQLLAGADELKLTPGWSPEADLQLSSEAGSPGTEQGEPVAADMQALDSVDKPELVELAEAEKSQADTQLIDAAGLETCPGGEHRAATELREEAEDGGRGQGECELPHEPGLDPQGEGAAAGVQPQEEAEVLDVVKDQVADANVQLLAGADELKWTPGWSPEADLQLSSEAGSPGTEQGEPVAPDVQPLDQVDKPELVEMAEAEDSQADTQLCGGVSSEPPQGGGGRAAVELREEAEDGTQGQVGQRLLCEPVLHPHAVTVRWGGGAAAGVQPREEAEILDVVKDHSADANVQLLAGVDEVKLSPGGSGEADLPAFSTAGMWQGEHSRTPGLEAALCAAHTADAWQGAAGAPVSPPDKAASYPKHILSTAESFVLEAMLGALTGPDGQILEDTETLETLQAERADAAGRPLNGTQCLEVVQGERMEAGARIFLEAPSLGIKQGHVDGASVLAPPVSEVTLQTSPLKLETMMQEDVLVPDMWRLGASGQAAQSAPQEQVSAQADKVSLHAASQQPEEKPPHVMETEQVAAGPAEPPKQEVPPASTLHMRVQQEEDAGNDQLGMVLGGSSLGDAANSSTQPQNQSEDFNVGQRKMMQEVGKKMSQEGEPSPGQRRAVTADGAGATPTRSPEASLDPDHLYNVLFIGDSHVGKTSFLHRLHANTFNPHTTNTIGLDYQVKKLTVDNKCFALRLWDSAGQERYHSLTKQLFRKADGIVLMYDVTSESSFLDVRYWLSCIQEGAVDGVAILLLGNKTDCAAQRQVPTKKAERLAKEHQLMFFECSAASGHNVSESIVSLIRSLKVHEDEVKNKVEEEASKPPQKKKGCCW